MQRGALILVVAANFCMYAGLAVPVFADPSEEAARFLAVPGGGEMFRGTDEQTFLRTALPAALVAVLGSHDWGIDDGSLPDTFVGYALDLNKDGRNEYFIENIGGGSGGPAFFVLAEKDNAWKIILEFQGGFYVMPTKDGWSRIIAISRGGGDNYTKLHYSFEGETYRNTRIERYRRGEITNEVISKPKE